MKKNKKLISSLVLIILLAIAGIVSKYNLLDNINNTTISINDVPEYSGEDYVSINNNIPSFTVEEKEEAMESYIRLSDLDSLGRCGSNQASLSLDTLPEEERGSIGMIKPSGWHTVRYDDLIPGKYLYNRGHLIAFCLSGLNAEGKNLITLTEHANGDDGMKQFEVMTVRYIEDTGNHVLYRVEPIYQGNNLVASGVHMEAESIEDNGKGIKFNVYVYNIEPGIVIDYATGDSQALTKAREHSSTALSE